jgi:hypothetical protein
VYKRQFMGEKIRHLARDYVLFYTSLPCTSHQLRIFWREQAGAQAPRIPM